MRVPYMNLLAAITGAFFILEESLKSRVAGGLQRRKKVGEKDTVHNRIVCAELEGEIRIGVGHVHVRTTEFAGRKVTDIANRKESICSLTVRDKANPQKLHNLIRLVGSKYVAPGLVLSRISFKTDNHLYFAPQPFSIEQKCRIQRRNDCRIYRKDDNYCCQWQILPPVHESV